jgi:hypothetical protein
MRLLKTIAAKILFALASNPALGGASTDPERVLPSMVHDTGDTFLAEMGVTEAAAHRPEYHARYAGPRMEMSEQLKAMTGRKLANGCLTARAETERFIAQRTR